MGYAAVLGSAEEHRHRGAEAFGPALWALAVEREVPRAADSSVTADGAEWIWNLAEDYFPDSVQIVDWYHVCQHLAQAAEALYPAGGERRERWFKQRRNDLFLGKLQSITQPLERAGRADQSRYFHVHQRRMRYQEFREDGYPIGSGTVEGGIKQFKARLTGPGTRTCGGAGVRWSRAGAERMLAIRSAVMADTFDQEWALAHDPCRLS